MPDYQAILNRAAVDDQPVTVELSAASLFLIADLLDAALSRRQWWGYDTWDDVEQMVNDAINEVLS